MAKAKAIITKTANPAGWLWSWDRIDGVPDGALDNFATAASASAALDAIKPLAAALPGSLSVITLIVETLEP